MIISPEFRIPGSGGAEIQEPYVGGISRVNQSGESELIYLPHSLDNPAARTRLLENGADPDDVAKVFDKQGKWLLRGTVGDYPDIWESDPGLLQQAVLIETRPAYDLINFSLRGEKYPDGFNRHDIEGHIVDVLQWSRFILDKSGYEGEVQLQRICRVAAAGHDIYNFDRDGHAVGSVLALATIMPDLTRSESEWLMTSDVIRYHDEKALLRLIGTPTSYEDAIRIIQAKGPVLPAIVLADKGGSIGRHRINKWARNLLALNRDSHMWTNYLAEGRGFVYSRDRRNLTNIIEFNPKISPYERDEFEEIARVRSHHKNKDQEDEFKAIVPGKVRELYRDHNIPHFLSWSSNMMRIYLERFKLEALCAKALNPNLDKFVIELRDRDNGRRRFIEEIQFDGHLNEQFAELDIAYKPKEERWPEDYQQLEIVTGEPNSQ